MLPDFNLSDGADALVIATPTSSHVDMEQLVGRGIRIESVHPSKRAAVRAAQKAARAARFAQRDAHRTSALYESEGGKLPGERPSDPTRGPRGTHCATPFVTRTVRKFNHPRRDEGYRRRKRDEAVKQQEAANERIAANQLRLAGLRAKGESLPGQRPNPATVRK